MRHIDAIDAEINYLSPDCKTPVYEMNAADGAGMPTFPPTWSQPMQIWNARKDAPNDLFEKRGFSLHREAIRDLDLYDKEIVKQEYFPVVENLIKKITGAEYVFCFHYFTRSINNHEPENTYSRREPVKIAHCDFSDKYAISRAAGLLGAYKGGSVSPRVLLVNAWMPINGPLVDWPLAFCDMRSAQDRDYVITPVVGDDDGMELYTLKYSPGHRWYFFPEMQRGEIVVFKQYDSRSRYLAKACAHTAFYDESYSGDMVPRESIEVRAMVVLDR